MKEKRESRGEEDMKDLGERWGDGTGSTEMN